MALLRSSRWHVNDARFGHKSQNQSHRVDVNKRRPRRSGLSRMIHIQDECVRRFILRIADIITNTIIMRVQTLVLYTAGQLGSYKNVNCSDHRNVIGVRLWSRKFDSCYEKKLWTRFKYGKFETLMTFKC